MQKRPDVKQEPQQTLWTTTSINYCGTTTWPIRGQAQQQLAYKVQLKSPIRIASEFKLNESHLVALSSFLLCMDLESQSFTHYRPAPSTDDAWSLDHSFFFGSLAFLGRFTVHSIGHIVQLLN